MVVDIVVIGGGEVCRERYLPALAKLESQGSARLVGVLDTNPTDTISRAVSSRFGDAWVSVLSDSEPSSVAAALRDKCEQKPLVVVATPTLTHVPIAMELLSEGYYVVIEKPYAGTTDQLMAIDSLVKQGEGSRLFFLGYYAIEKGLPALLLSTDQGIRRRVADWLTRSQDDGDTRDLLDSFGRLMHIDGVLLEGRGNAGMLDQRHWVLHEEVGGNTVETFYHLVCMGCAVLPNRSVEVTRAKRSVCKSVSDYMMQEHGCLAAETATVADLKYGDVTATLACAKYVADEIHERWMRFEYERGECRIDFEKSSLTLHGVGGHLGMSMRPYTKYVPQLTQACQHYRSRDADAMYPAFRDALRATLDVRRSFEGDLLTYEQGALGVEWREKVLHSGGW